MGSNFIIKSFDGKLTNKELETAFWSAVEQSKYEDGASYSGEIGMAPGLDIIDNTFHSEYDAHTWLDENCIKWENAKAVKHRFDSGVRWLIGCQCSS